MFYNPSTGETKSRSELQALLSCMIAASAATVGEDWYALNYDPRPSYDAETQSVEAGEIVKRKGTYYQTYTVSDRDPETVSSERFAYLRSERDRRLTATDKYMLADFPISEEQRAAYAQYRAALRDLPEAEDAPWTKATIPWPQEPVLADSDGAE